MEKLDPSCVTSFSEWAAQTLHIRIVDARHLLYPNDITAELRQVPYVDAMQALEQDCPPHAEQISWMNILSRMIILPSSGQDPREDLFITRDDMPQLFETNSMVIKEIGHLV